MAELQCERRPARQIERAHLVEAAQTFQNGLLRWREDGSKHGSPSRCKNARQKAVVLRDRVLRPRVSRNLLIPSVPYVRSDQRAAAACSRRRSWQAYRQRESLS